MVMNDLILTSNNFTTVASNCLILGQVFYQVVYFPSSPHFIIIWSGLLTGGLWRGSRGSMDVIQKK